MKGYTKRRIGTIVLAPSVTFVIIVSIAAIIAFLKLSADLNDVVDEHIHSMMDASQELSTQKVTSAEKACESFNNDYAIIYDAVRDGDKQTLVSELDWTKEAASAEGYIFTDMNGATLASSFPESATAEMNEAIKYVIANDPFSASAFVDSKLIKYSTTVVKNNESEEVGVVILVSDIIQLGTNSSKHMGMDQLIFTTDGCAMASMTNKFSELTLDPQIGNTCFGKKEMWVGETSILDNDCLAAAFPIVDFKGNAIGAHIFVGNTARIDSILSNLRVGLPLLLVVFFAVISYMLWNIRRRMIKPVNVLIDELNHIADGDLTRSLQVGDACHEIGLIAQSIHRAEDKIRDLFEPIRHAADNLVNAATQMNKAADNLSNAANRQAASLEEISSSMEEMGANIQQNTDNSIQTSKLTEEMANATTRLGVVSKACNDAIKTIADSIEDINDLVSQTNILALNASVEAARAGEQGQGFGVVAKEVGRLAEQTHDTADNINATAESSIAGAEEAFNYVNELTPRIEKINVLVKGITTASIEQNTGVQQVNTAIMDLNRMTQQNAAGAEEIAASTAQLQDMARSLSEALGSFKTEE